MEKQTLTVLVGGKNYTLTSSDPPEYVRRVAAYVDRKLRETAAVTNLPSAQGAVLTCFQLADELLKAQDENRTLRLQMERMGGTGGQSPVLREGEHGDGPRVPGPRERRLAEDGTPGRQTDGKAEG